MIPIMLMSFEPSLTVKLSLVTLSARYMYGTSYQLYSRKFDSENTKNFGSEKWEKSIMSSNKRLKSCSPARQSCLLVAMVVMEFRYISGQDDALNLQKCNEHFQIRDKITI